MRMAAASSPALVGGCGCRLNAARRTPSGRARGGAASWRRTPVRASANKGDVDNSNVDTLLVDSGATAQQDGSEAGASGPSTAAEAAAAARSAAVGGTNWRNVGRRVVAWGPLAALTAYVASDLVKDLGFTTGDENDFADPYDGIKGVGTLYKTAIFAGGCFWCMEAPFDGMEGVLATVSGYSGGRVERPTYREVSSGVTGHAECVQVVYDPAKVTYEQLLDTYWHQINPTTPNQQFFDKGTQYRTAIFYQTEEERELAERSKAELEARGVFGAPIVTEVTKAGTFWPAEKYHQNYYLTTASRYEVYRGFSGRDEYIESIWGPEYVRSQRH